VTLQVLDVSRSGTPHPAAKALYFTVEEGTIYPGGARKHEGR